MNKDAYFPGPVKDHNKNNDGDVHYNLIDIIPPPATNVIIFPLVNISRWGCDNQMKRAPGEFPALWWDCQLVHPLGKSIWRLPGHVLKRCSIIPQDLLDHVHSSLIRNNKNP